MNSSTLAFRVPLEIKEQIDRLAIASHRKKSDILLSWISEKLDLESWQIAETNKAIQCADAGEFATAEQVLAMRTKWKV